ncbi:DET1- and DDB1-associated protein 1-like isoform X4 [Phragmites australis]|uniref:DET1- and DDB1-associated protein 1-like isoform X4 n=1 Tax=Phragmites australis TaxID=29695 RepID=UPI002D79F185|nr:DET1- and DDB1-associated protein 1-like isoform X4 [Phragmites australis]
MGSPLGGWPSYNPHNFSQIVPADPSAQPSVECHTNHLHCDSQDRSASQSRTAVITTESRNILLRHFYQNSEEKLRPKRAAPDNLAPENNNKQPRGPVADGGSQSNTRS